MAVIGLCSDVAPLDNVGHVDMCVPFFWHLFESYKTSPVSEAGDREEQTRWQSGKVSTLEWPCGI